jgi:hypothetical protein
VLPERQRHPMIQTLVVCGSVEQVPCVQSACARPDGTEQEGWHSQQQGKSQRAIAPPASHLLPQLRHLHPHVCLAVHRAVRKHGGDGSMSHALQGQPNPQRPNPGRSLAARACGTAPSRPAPSRRRSCETHPSSTPVAFERARWPPPPPPARAAAASSALSAATRRSSFFVLRSTTAIFSRRDASCGGVWGGGRMQVRKHSRGRAARRRWRLGGLRQVGGLPPPPCIHHKTQSGAPPNKRPGGPSPHLLLQDLAPAARAGVLPPQLLGRRLGCRELGREPLGLGGAVLGQLAYHVAVRLVVPARQRRALRRRRCAHATARVKDERERRAQ